MITKKKLYLYKLGIIYDTIELLKYSYLKSSNMKKLFGLTLLCTAFSFCFLSCSETENTPVAKTILISAHQLDMYIGDESILTYYITPPESLCNVFWNSSNDSVVSVDSIGQV